VLGKGATFPALPKAIIRMWSVVCSSSDWPGIRADGWGIVGPRMGKSAHVVFIQCAGSRDPAKGRTICSKDLLHVHAKHAMLYKHKVTAGGLRAVAWTCARPARAIGEFYRRLPSRMGWSISARARRRVSENGSLIVQAADTLKRRRAHRHQGPTWWCWRRRPARRPM